MKKVLIVEDDEMQRMLYEAEISEMGYQVLLAKDGDEALQEVRQKKPDIVILDLRLPGMHGIEVLRKALGIDPNLPVIIHTAYSHFKSNFMSWAAEEYIVKSSDLGELRSTIDRVLSRSVGSGVVLGESV